MDRWDYYQQYRTMIGRLTDQQVSEALALKGATPADLEYAREQYERECPVPTALAVRDRLFKHLRRGESIEVARGKAPLRAKPEDVEKVLQEWQELRAEEKAKKDRAAQYNPAPYGHRPDGYARTGHIGSDPESLALEDEMGTDFAPNEIYGGDI